MNIIKDEFTYKDWSYSKKYYWRNHTKVLETKKAQAKENQDKRTGYMRKWRSIPENKLKDQFFANRYIKENITKTTNGRKVHGKKRVRPESCEICQIAKSKVYHHWKEEPNKTTGIWICQSCHKKVHAKKKLDPVILVKYEQVRRVIDENN